MSSFLKNLRHQARKETAGDWYEEKLLACEKSFGGEFLMPRFSEAARPCMALSISQYDVIPDNTWCNFSQITEKSWTLLRISGQV